MALSISDGINTGSQTTTQSPQASVGPGGTASRTSGNVQPGTATSLLNNDKGGVSLQNKQLSLVSLGTRQSKVSQFTPPLKHHVNPALYGVSGLLFLLAAAVIVAIISASKTTTE